MGTVTICEEHTKADGRDGAQTEAAACIRLASPCGAILGVEWVVAARGTAGISSMQAIRDCAKTASGRDMNERSCIDSLRSCIYCVPIWSTATRETKVK